MGAAIDAQRDALQSLNIDKITDGSIVFLRFRGTISESFDGKKAALGIGKAKTVILDLGEVERISSFGIREWSDFVSVLERQVQQIIAVECSPKVVDQMNMVVQFLGAKGYVLSFYAPYRCDYCDTDRRVLMHFENDYESIRSLRLPEQLCETCGRAEYFDDAPASYFAFLGGQRPLELPKDVGDFLSSKLRYSIAGGGGGHLHVTKYVEERFTFLKLVGTLDGSFASTKVAEGLEGTVVVDLAGIGNIDLAGAAEWRNFTNVARSTIDRLLLVDVPPSFHQRLPQPGELGGEVISFLMPYQCAQCSTTTSQVIDVEQHADILKFATPPEMKCAECKQPTVCVAPERVLSHLRSLTAVSVDARLRKFIKESRERKSPALPREKAADAPEGVVTRIRVLTLLVVAALVAIVSLLVINWLQSRDTRELEKTVAGVKEATDNPTPARPAWVVSDTPSSAYCTDLMSRLSCTGVSSYMESREAGRSEAVGAALDELVNQLSLKIDAPWFAEKIRTQFEEERARALMELEKVRANPRSAAYKTAVEKVRTARKGLAEALTLTGGAAAPSQQAGWYWEEYANDAKDGTEFLVFVRYEINYDSLKALIIEYSDTVDLLGGKVVTMFPARVWKSPQPHQGALVLHSSGALRTMGIPDQSVVVAVNGESVRTAPDLAAKVKKLENPRDVTLTVITPDGATKDVKRK